MSSTEEDRQSFFQLILEYTYIREGGRLQLEPFGVYLSHCFGHDGILDMSPYPNDVYTLLIDLIEEKYEDSRFIERRTISDWKPEMAYIYPDKVVTCIHPAALIGVSHDWIYLIGHELMEIPHPDKTSKYFEWVKEEWTAVHAFINGFHNALHTFHKDFDRKGIKDKGFSAFEALHLSMQGDISYDDAVKVLSGRHSTYTSAIQRIESAISSSYFLEAITLEECLISNCIYNYLHSKGTRLRRPTFNSLLREVLNGTRPTNEAVTSLFEQIDTWRVSRNKSIHGFIEARSNGLEESARSFDLLANETAVKGLDYCNAVVSWYELECVNFITHEFPRNSRSD